MADQRPKEPLIAIALGLILTGLGQIYAGRTRRGLIFLLIAMVWMLVSVIYMLHPKTPINMFAFASVIASFIFSIFVTVDAYRCAKEYNAIRGLERRLTFGTSLILVLLALIIIFHPLEIIFTHFFRPNFFEAFKVPTKAMSPAIIPGDRIFVDKRIYKKSDPQRGDIVAFEAPVEQGKFYVKRIVGLPGETVEIKDGSILINGIQLREPEVFTRLRYSNFGEYGQKGLKVEVFDNAYFVLGDNTFSSRDSRHFGLVTRDRLVGKVYKIYFPFERSGPI